MAVATIPAGVDFAAPDGEPVKVLFVVVSPESSPAEHLRCLAAISKWIKESGDLERLARETDPDEIYRLLTGESPASASPAGESREADGG